ncbi:MAG: S1C family serine protease [Eubacteriales bacterium]
MEENEHFSFIQEKIKQKPYSRKKLLRRMAITVAMAVIFGFVACFTFLILEPVFNNWIHPEEEAQIITFPKYEDEITLEDIVTSDEELASAEQVQNDLAELADETLAMFDELSGVTNYEILHNELYQIVTEAERSLVTIESVTSDVDWFDNQYEQGGRTSGFLVANNGLELIVIFHGDAINYNDTLRVTFCDDTQATATVKQIDEQSQLVALAVSLDEVLEDTLQEIEIATLGSSVSSYIMATPVIAAGRPLGYQDSIVYGMVTSTDNEITIADGVYYSFTTNIVGSEEASGVVLDLQGRIVGIIAQEYARDGQENYIVGMGITEIKALLEKISNGKAVPYLGIHPVDVPTSIQETLQVPQGVYVSTIDMESPAMNQGIQSGDVVVAIDETEIRSTSAYMSKLMSFEAGETVRVTLMRQSGSGYKEMQIDITLED